MENLKIKHDLPGWMKNQEEIILNKKNNNYISINLRTVSKLISYFQETNLNYVSKYNSLFTFIQLIIIAICVVLSKNIFFLWIIFVYLLLNLIFLPTSIFYKIGNKFLKLSLVSLILFFPSIFIFSNNVLLFFLRQSLIIFNISLYISTNNWQNFLLALKQLKLPTTLILILDITIKYIYILSMYLKDILDGIRLRTLGQSVDYKLIGVLIGQLYFISKKKMLELYQVMMLRGGGESFENNRKITISLLDYFLITKIIIILCLFLYFENFC